MTNQLNMERDSEKSTSDTLQTILGAVIGIYFIISQIITIVFWWKMMKEDSFFMGIFVDPFIAEFKGLLWPFFI